MAQVGSAAPGGDAPGGFTASAGASPVSTGSVTETRRATVSLPGEQTAGREGRRGSRLPGPRCRSRGKWLRCACPAAPPAGAGADALSGGAGRRRAQPQDRWGPASRGMAGACMAAWKGAAALSSSAARPCPDPYHAHTPAEYKVVQREQVANPAPLGMQELLEEGGRGPAQDMAGAERRRWQQLRVKPAAGGGAAPNLKPICRSHPWICQTQLCEASLCRLIMRRMSGLCWVCWGEAQHSRLLHPCGGGRGVRQHVAV